MTAKRFTINGKEIIQDKQVWCIAGSEHCADVIATAMNELHEENRKLQRHLDVMRSGALTDDKRIKELYDENEQLKQFKEDVFNKIDMHLRMLPTARDNEFNEDDGDPSLYVGAIYMLETLKKELKE